MIHHSIPKIIFVILTACFFGCKQNYPSGGPYFYKSWKTYQIPFQPIEPISAEEARKAVAYYEAFFNSSGKVLKFTKYINGQVEFAAIYAYSPDGKLDSGEIIKKNGENEVQHFDKNGKIIKAGE
jgi:antitoxin component YwqK of YwqJK toxin-antitoxin module